MSKETQSRQKVQQLRDLIRGRSSLLIVMQNYPDPDALASAAALREFARHVESGLSCTLASSGLVGRAENRALLKYLRLSNQFLGDLDLAKFDLVALVDTQPGTGNNILPEGARPSIVIDHHPIRKASRSAAFTDVRSRYGATATILFEYLREMDVPLNCPLVTAMAYGIRSDTQDLGREARRADIDAFLYLYPLANKRMLSEIQYCKTPRSYFRMLSRALQTAQVFPGAIISSIETIEQPDIVGEVADLLLREENTTWTLCYGYYNGAVLASLRTMDPKGDAGKLMHRLVSRMGTGGGHSAMAGGQIPLPKGKEDFDQVAEKLQDRFLKSLRISRKKGTDLLEDASGETAPE